MKTICFDLRALQIGHENRGIGMYIKSVLENLPADDNKYVFYVFDKSNPVEKLGIELNNSYEIIETATIKTVLNSPRELPGLIRLINHRFHPLKKIKPDVFVQFDFTLGAPRWKQTQNIIIGYDLIPLIMKNEYLPSLSFTLKHTANTMGKTQRGILRSLVFRISHRSFAVSRSKIMPKTLIALIRSVYYNQKYRLHYKTYKRADKIICISKATSEDFAKILGIDRRKIYTVPLAAVLSDDKPDFSIAKKITKPYVFYIGGTDVRKRIQDIVHAFNIAKGHGADMALVLAGNEFKKLNHLPSIEGRNAIMSSPYKKDIHLVGFVTDEQKKGLYESAHAFIFTTIYEGFGLPILEAMSSSCPVITYNNSSIPEAAGKAALLIETGDYTAIARAIIALEDPKLRKKMISAGLKQSKKFSWKKMSKQLLSIIEGSF